MNNCVLPRCVCYGVTAFHARMLMLLRGVVVIGVFLSGDWESVCINYVV